MRCLLFRTRLAVALAFATAAHSHGVDFWVWHRTQPLTEEERTSLRSLDVKTLYWHVGEMENRSGKWRWKTAPRAAAELAAEYRLVPVVRLTCEDKDPFPPGAVPSMREEFVRVAGVNGALQIDYDCPDRLLPKYATALREMRAAIPHLSITALAGWPRLAGFTKLTDAVEEIAPMFYDLQADPTGVTLQAPPPPLLDPAQFEEALQPWKKCPIPWRAGLPTFARLTVFDRTGLSRGQIPNWSWDDLCFHRSLRTLAPTHLGVTLFQTDIETRVASVPVGTDELVVSRSTDRLALARAQILAQAAGASGVVLFRLPDGTGPGGWSLGDLAQGASVKTPSLILRRTSGEELELVNPSSADLPPRLSGDKSDRDRGYALEIDAAAPVFREALPGDFWRVASHAQPEAKKPVAVVVPLATRLTFWFSHLRGHDTLRTGLLQFAPNASVDSLRYRILAGGTAGEWKPIAPAVFNPSLP